MPSDIITIASIVIAVAALLLTLWQNVLQRRAAQSQVFLHMLDQFGSGYVSDGYKRIVKWHKYDSYNSFEQNEPEEVQDQIYKLVEFLNDTARLVMTGYLPQQSVWDIYFLVYRTTYEKLSPWWLAGQRESSYKQKFIAFEEMCLRIEKVTDRQMDNFDAEQYPLWHKKYGSQGSHT